MNKFGGYFNDDNDTIMVMLNKTRPAAVMWPVCAAHCGARCRKSCCAAVRPAPRVRPPTQHASPSPDTTDGLPPWLLTWDAAMTAARIRMGSKILLFLVACVSASSRDGGGDGDASCDGAFDIYFVLDRWVETDGRGTAGGSAGGSAGQSPLSILSMYGPVWSARCFAAGFRDCFYRILIRKNKSFLKNQGRILQQVRLKHQNP